MSYFLYFFIFMSLIVISQSKPSKHELGLQLENCKYHHLTDETMESTAKVVLCKSGKNNIFVKPLMWIDLSTARVYYNYFLNEHILSYRVHIYSSSVLRLLINKFPASTVSFLHANSVQFNLLSDNEHPIRKVSVSDYKIDLSDENIEYNVSVKLNFGLNSDFEANQLKRHFGSKPDVLTAHTRAEIEISNGYDNNQDDVKTSLMSMNLQLLNNTMWTKIFEVSNKSYTANKGFNVTSFGNLQDKLRNCVNQKLLMNTTIKVGLCMSEKNEILMKPLMWVGLTTARVYYDFLLDKHILSYRVHIYSATILKLIKNNFRNSFVNFVRVKSIKFSFISGNKPIKKVFIFGNKMNVFDEDTEDDVYVNLNFVLNSDSEAKQLRTNFSSKPDVLTAYTRAEIEISNGFDANQDNVKTSLMSMNLQILNDTMWTKIIEVSTKNSIFKLNSLTSSYSKPNNVATFGKRGRLHNLNNCKKYQLSFNETVILCKSGKTNMFVKPLMWIDLTTARVYYDFMLDQHILSYQVHIYSNSILKRLQNKFQNLLVNFVRAKFIKFSFISENKSIKTVFLSGNKINVFDENTENDVFVILNFILNSNSEAKQLKFNFWLTSEALIQSIKAEIDIEKELYTTSVMFSKINAIHNIQPGFIIWRKTFEVTNIGSIGKIQNFIVPYSGCYKVTAFGAQGGWHSDGGTHRGGFGASKEGLFDLIMNTQMQIVVGQAGGNSSNWHFSAGGGGGTFIYDLSESLLLAAGGGGGASNYLNGTDGHWGAAGGGGGFSGGGAGTINAHSGGGGGSYASPAALKVSGKSGGNPNFNGQAIFELLSPTSCKEIITD